MPARPTMSGQWNAGVGGLSRGVHPGFVRSSRYVFPQLKCTLNPHAVTHHPTIKSRKQRSTQVRREPVPPEKMYILSLPAELLLSIVWSDRLDQYDVQALRLSCRALAPVAASRLFFRIYISKLIADRDAFLAICNSPHLVQHVREVEWLEVRYAPGDFGNKNKTIAKIYLEDGKELGVLDALHQHMETASTSLFWLFNTPAVPSRDGVDYDAIAATRENTIASFRPIFEAAVDNLPNLQTFVSRPMTSQRTLPDLEYPISACHFQILQNETEDNPETNDGLFLFLLPVMGRPTSAVANLRWHDEFPSCTFSRPFPDSAFKGLESLEIIMMEWMRRGFPGDALAGLETALLNAAPSLRQFKLSMDVDSTSVEHYSQAWTLGGTMLKWLGNGQFALRSLSLSSMIPSPDLLPQLIKANATSLRHLCLDNIPVSSQQIRDMAQIQGLQLESIQIVRNEEVAYGETSLLGDVYDDTGDGVSEVGDEALINPESSGFGNGLLRTEFVTEAALLRYLRGQAPVNDDDRRVHDAVNPYNHVFISTHTRSEDDCGASERSSEDDSVEHRRRTAPRWAWGRYFHVPGHKIRGLVFAFPVPEGGTVRGHKTERWSFISRDGRVAYGDDPWEWFEDWDPDAGDREEPLPYCAALEEFANLKADAEGLSPEEFLGERSEARGLRPPEGAIRYNSIDNEESKTHQRLR